MNTEELIEELSIKIEKSLEEKKKDDYENRHDSYCIIDTIKSFMESNQVTFTSTSKAHYQQIPELQAWDFARSMPYDTGTAFCYLWRAGLKGDRKADLQKALDHLEHRISQPVQTPRDYEHLFMKYFSERIALAMVELLKGERIGYAMTLIQDELNETT
jgi:phosphoserine aminotransferase